MTTHDPHVLALEPAADVGRLVGSELLDAAVHPGQVDRDVVRRVALPVLEADTQLGRARQIGHQLGGGDQCLARHTVGDHGRPAQAVTVDDRDLRTELRGDQRGLVTPGATAEDHDAVGGLERRCRHALIVSHGSGPMAPLILAPVTSAPLTVPTGPPGPR